MMTRVTAVIQARLGSTRLPGKMLYELGGLSNICHIISRVQKSTSVDEIVVATSTADHDDALANHLRRHEISVHRGPEEDVLCRIYEAAAKMNSDIIVRVCGDNPLLSPECIDSVVSVAKQDGVDYAATNLDNSFPVGLDVEAFTMDSFVEIEADAEIQTYREHVTLYYKDNPNRFSLKNVSASDVFNEEFVKKYSHLRLTLDTPEDYQLLYEVYENISCQNNFVPLNSALEYIVTEGLETSNDSVNQTSTNR